MNINWKHEMGNANSGKKGDQVESGKKKKQKLAHISSYLASRDS